MAHFGLTHAMMETRQLQSANNREIIQNAFVTFFMDTLRSLLRKLVMQRCDGCSRFMQGKENHTCQLFPAMDDAYQRYGDRAIYLICASDKRRWEVAKKFWDFIFDHDEICENSLFADATDLIRENDTFVKIKYEWRAQLETAIQTAFWTVPGFIETDSDNDSD